MPFLSVIIPIYNAEKYLDDCFRSIQKQSFTDYEVILIDDGATDSSPQICDKYVAEDAKFKVFHVPNGGPSKARNLGFIKATGKYIYCIDNDDCIENGELFQAIYDSLAQNPVDVLQMGAKYLRAGETSPRKVLSLSAIDRKLISCPSQTIFNLIVNGKYETSCWTKVIDRQFLLENKLFFDETLTVEDLDWNMRIFLKLNRYNLLPNKDYLHFFRTGSISSALGAKNYKNCCDQVKVIRRWAYFYRDAVINPELKQAVMGYLCYQYFITLGRYGTLDKEYRNDIYSELKKLDYLFQYTLGKKQKVVYWAKKIGGFHMVLLGMGWYFKKLRSGSK